MTRLDRDRPLIVSGPPRSGTTLLYALFDGHPDVFWLVSEGYLFEVLHDLGTGNSDLLLQALDRPLDEIVEGLRDRELMPLLEQGYRQDAGTMSRVAVTVPWSGDRFREALDGPRPTSLRDLWRWLVGGYAAAMGAAQGRLYACMKSPDYAKSAAAVSAAIPEARSLVIVREPLRMIASLKKSRAMRGTKTLTWPLLAAVVAELNRATERVAAASDDAVRWLRYEDLVRAPEPTMRGVADWLDIPFSPRLVEPTILGTAWPGHSSFAPTSGIDPAPTERPLSGLLDHEVSYVERAARPFLDFFYPDRVPR